jgi:hypothetical protein
MPDASRIAAAINLRVRQLEAQGITGIALANHMIGHMHDLHRIYNTTSDRTLRDLCRRFPGFERYARLMEEVSEQNQAMVAAGAHPYGDLPELPEPLKASLLHVMRSAAELESKFQAAVDGGRDHQAERLIAMRRRWADDLRKLMHEFRSSDLPLRTQALVQQAVKAVAERIERMGQE